MAADAEKGRGAKPTVFSDLTRLQGVDDIVEFIIKAGGLTPRAAAA